MAITVKVPNALRDRDLVRASANALRALPKRLQVAEPNASREDRLVRTAIALSAAGLGGFATLASNQLSVVSMMFLLLGGYLVVTAITGRDLLYARYGIDTTSDEDLRADDDVSWLWSEAGVPDRASELAETTAGVGSPITGEVTAGAEQEPTGDRAVGHDRTARGRTIAGTVEGVPTPDCDARASQDRVAASAA